MIKLVRSGISLTVELAHGVRQTWVQFPDPRPNLKLNKILRSPLFWIFLLALALRIYKLGTLPYGFHVDEVKVGWNAISILATGRDDHGNLLAPYYNSFGDFRPTGIFYLTIPSILIFGGSEFAVRFSSALFGALTILPIYLIGQYLFQSKKFKYAPAVLLAISPWAIETSRATSEVVISIFFALFGIYFFLKLIQKQNRKDAILAIVLILTSYFLYHSVRVLAPAFFITIAFFYFKKYSVVKKQKPVLITIGVITIASLIIGLGKSSRERLGQVSIFKDTDLTYQIQRTISENKRKSLLSLIFDNRLFIYSERFVNEYGSYFNPNFLIGNAARPYRYTTPGVGLLTFVEGLLLILGITQILKGKGNYLPLILLLIAPLPAILTSEDSPNLHRAYLMLPFLILIESYGITFLSEIKKYKRIIPLTYAFLFLNFIFFLHMYFSHSLNHQPFIKNLPLNNASYRDVGAKELALKLQSVSKNYDKVIITGFPDNLYPWFAFFNKIDPKVFNKNLSQYGNITFSNLRCPSDNSFIDYYDKNILVIDFADCPYESKIRDGLPIKVVDGISRPDGVAVYIFLAKTGPIPDKFLKK